MELAPWQWKFKKGHVQGFHAFENGDGLRLGDVVNGDIIVFDSFSLAHNNGVITWHFGHDQLTQTAKEFEGDKLWGLLLSYFEVYKVLNIFYNVPINKP